MVLHEILNVRVDATEDELLEAMLLESMSIRGKPMEGADLAHLIETVAAGATLLERARYRREEQVRRDAWARKIEADATALAEKLQKSRQLMNDEAINTQKTFERLQEMFSACEKAAEQEKAALREQLATRAKEITHAEQNSAALSASFQQRERATQTRLSRMSQEGQNLTAQLRNLNTDLAVLKQKERAMRAELEEKSHENQRLALDVAKLTAQLAAGRSSST